MTEHNDPILQEALNDLADIQFCDNDHNQAVEEERQCENIIVVMASKYADEIAAMQKDIDTLWESNGTSDKEIGDLKAEIERLKGESEIQRSFFNAAMDRAEKAEAENDRLTTERNSLRGRFEAEQYYCISLKNAYENDTDSLSNRLELIGADFLKSQQAVKDLTSENDKLKVQNARMREALEKYADRRNWEYRPGLMEGDCDFFFLPGNGWDVAEKALEEISHE